MERWSKIRDLRERVREDLDDLKQNMEARGVFRIQILNLHFCVTQFLHYCIY